MAAKKNSKTKPPYVGVYFLDYKLFSDLAKEAADQHRKLSPMIMMILREHFEKKKGGKNVNPNAA